LLRCRAHFHTRPKPWWLHNDHSLSPHRPITDSTGATDSATRLNNAKEVRCNMKVIFLEDIPGTADAGEVKNVKNGFARNYLLPRGLAAPATPDQLQRSRAVEVAAKDKRIKLSSDWQVVASSLKGAHITLEAAVGPSGRLHGAITSKHIAQEISRTTEREIDHRQVLLGEAIHEPGDFSVGIRLYREVQTTINVSVVPEGYVADQIGTDPDQSKAAEPQPSGITDVIEPEEGDSDENENRGDGESAEENSS
jgi:large subunit ribosomal protein L9